MDYNARWYGQRFGRFTQPDSIIPNFEYPQNLNRFSYVGNNPIINVDPSGHLLQRCLEKICGPQGDGIQPDDKGYCQLHPGECRDSGRNQGSICEERPWHAGCQPIELEPDPFIEVDWDVLAERTQYIATGISTVGAGVEITATVVGCLWGSAAFGWVDGPLLIADAGSGLAGCAVGAGVGNGIYRTFFNPLETLFSTVSYVATLRSDFESDETGFVQTNQGYQFVIGANTRKSTVLFVAGSFTNIGVFDAAVDWIGSWQFISGD